MTVTTQNYQDSMFVVGRGYLCLRKDDEHCRRGHFWSQHGFVDVFTADHPRWKVTSLTFIHQGTQYSRRWERVWGDRTISRLAREFAEEIVGQ